MGSGVNVHLYPSDLTNESRMMKITAALGDFDYFERIELIGILSPGTQAEEIVDGKRVKRRFARPAATGRWGKGMGTLRWSWAVWRDLKNKDISCINCHSLPVLPLCVLLKIRHRALLIYDTHELETETSESYGVRRAINKLTERLLMPFADYVFVVGEMIADWYRMNYRMARPFVVRNISDPAPAVPGEISPLRGKLGVGPDAVVVLYLGRIAEKRGIETLLWLFAQAAWPVHLAFMGEGPLVPMVRDYATRYPTIHYLPPVLSKEVVAHARGADIGLSVMDRSCLSYTYAMPNKFFESLQAGIPVIIGDMPEQRKIIEAHGAGWVLPEGDDAALAWLNALTRDDVEEKKRHAAAIAKDFSWAREREVLRAAYATIARAQPHKMRHYG